MAAGLAARVIHAPGRVVIGPTNLSNAYPHGGTEVGKTNAFAIQPQGTPFRVECEGLGEATDILEANNAYTAAFFLRGWDDEAVEKMTNGFVVGGTSRRAIFRVPANVPGTSSSGRAVILLYVPDDIIHVPSILIFAGIPDWTQGGELAFQRGEELGLPITVDCLRDSNNNMLDVARFTDLSLT